MSVITCCRTAATARRGGERESAYWGRYEVTGDHIEYWDDTGFTADGNFIDGVLHHGGMMLIGNEQRAAKQGPRR